MSKINPVFEEFAEVFIGNINTEEDIPYPENLAREELDYSLDSLKFVDQWLETLHKFSEQLSDREWHLAVLRGGSYVGQVIRDNASNVYNWVDYNDYVPQRPELQKMIPTRSTNTCALLVSEQSSMTMPLNKVARYISEGKENNTEFYAKAECQDA